MSSNSGLTPPGSSSYTSNTMHVGDGTWDSTRDTFLLPNLVGLNFATMRYNGMGNRFKGMPEYYTLILAHGIIAAVIFLGLVPLLVLIVRYYSRWNPYWAYKWHTWLLVLTLLLTTVVFVLGYFAVGPERSLTNPHHGIGVAIYILVIFEVLGGWWAHKRERAKTRRRISLTLYIHSWLGWALAILGIVQIALGLTLYGSPKVLFILYTLGAFAWLAAVFVLSYVYDCEDYYSGSDYDSRHSYLSAPSGAPDSRHGNFGRMASTAAAGAGLAELFGRRGQNNKRSQVYDDPHHDSYMDEKYSGNQRRDGWGKRILEIGAVAGGLALAKKVFARRRTGDFDSESGRYSRAHTRSDSMTEATMSRVEEAQPPASETSTSRLESRPPDSGYDYYNASSYFTNDNEEDDRGRFYGVRDALLSAGAFVAIRNFFKRRKAKDEQRRVEEIQRRDAEEEKMARANSRQYTGDGFFPRNRRAASYNATDKSATDVTPQPPPAPPPHGGLGQSEIPVASGAAQMQPSGTSPIPPMEGEVVPSNAPNPMPNQPVPPAHDAFVPNTMQNLISNQGIPPAQGANTPPYPAPSQGEADRATSVVDFASGASAMGAATLPSSGQRPPRSSGRQPDEPVESPPVSVKVKMHNDGRHVTLRRLTEEEAAATRESRRRERRSSRRRQGSGSSLSGNESGSSRWRRIRQQAEQAQRQQQGASAAAASGTAPEDGTNSVDNTPPEAYAPPPASASFQPPVPPPAPSSLPYGAGSITSPGTWTGTEASGDYASNRRRRRAERARARQERQQQHGVEFT